MEEEEPLQPRGLPQQSGYLSVCPPASLSVHLSVSLSICVSVCLSVCLSISMPVCYLSSCPPALPPSSLSPSLSLWRLKEALLSAYQCKSGRQCWELCWSVALRRAGERARWAPRCWYGQSLGLLLSAIYSSLMTRGHRWLSATVQCPRFTTVSRPPANLLALGWSERVLLVFVRGARWYSCRNWYIYIYITRVVAGGKLCMLARAV